MPAHREQKLNEQGT